MLWENDCADVLDNDDTLLWLALYWHRGCHSNAMTSRRVLSSFAGISWYQEVFRKSIKGTCTSQRHLDDGKVWKVLWERYQNFWRWGFGGYKLTAKMILTRYFKTRRFGKSVSPGCSLISFKIVCKTVIGMLWPIARKTDLMSVRSCALVAIFA